MAHRWDELIDLIEFAINNAISSATGLTPFQFAQGQHPRTPLGEWNAPDDEQPDIAALEFFLMQQAVLETARRHTIDAAAASASSWDISHPSAAEFAEGDSVWISSAPFNLSKTAPRWLGPFPIKRIITATTFELDVPSTFGAHPVWHAEHLRKARTDLRRASHAYPVIEPPLQVESILAHRRLPGRGMQFELTVKWRHRPLGFQPTTIKLPEALLKGAAITRAYFAQWNLGQL